MIIIDGNDGLGKSTVCLELRKLGYEVEDRGLATIATDKPETLDSFDLAKDGNMYVILDAPVDVSRQRLGMAGKDLTEKYHTVEDLTHYRDRFRDVAERMACPVVDSSGTREQTLARVKAVLGIERETYRVGIPKGRLFGCAYDWVCRSGYEFTTVGRGYRPTYTTTNLDGRLPTTNTIELFLLKPKSMAQMVALSMLDAAIIGEDLAHDSLYSERLVVAAKLTKPVIHIAVAAADKDILRKPVTRPLVIASEYPCMADNWATTHGLPHITINTYGSTEAYAPIFADLVIDVVETGQTLKDNGLTVIDTVMKSSPAVITRQGAASHHRFLGNMAEGVQP